MRDTTQARIWWPADWADETMPAGRSSPDGFIINANGPHPGRHYFPDIAAMCDDIDNATNALNFDDYVHAIICQIERELQAGKRSQVVR